MNTHTQPTHILFPDFRKLQYVYDVKTHSHTERINNDSDVVCEYNEFSYY